MIWNKNLLTDLGAPPPLPPAAAIAAGGTRPRSQQSLALTLHAPRP
jgi:hypothetical protein